MKTERMSGVAMFGRMLTQVAGCDYAFAGWWRYDLLGGLDSLEERGFDLGKTGKSGGECLVHLGGNELLNSRLLLLGLCAGFVRE